MEVTIEMARHTKNNEDKFKKAVEDGSLCDLKTMRLNEASDHDSIREGALYAGGKFRVSCDRLKVLMEMLEDAALRRDDETYRQLDDKFWQTALLVSVYTNEKNRLMKIWSNQTGVPSIVTDCDGNLFFYEPEHGVADVTTVEEVEQFRKSLCETHQAATGRKRLKDSLNVFS